MERTDNQAALVFNNTGDIAFLGTGNRTLALGGNSTGDNQINLRLIDNPLGGVLTVNRTGYSAYWTLGNQNNTYSGPTNIQGGALIAIDGASLPVTSNLRFNRDWAGNSFFQSSGVFNRTLGTGTANSQWQAGTVTGFAGFAADRAKLVVDWTGQNLVWGNADGTANFLKGASFALNSGNSLADIEVRGNFEIRTNAPVAAGVLTTSEARANTATIRLAGGNASLLAVGQLITGTGIPAGTYITSYNTQTEINLSRTITSIASGVALTVSGGGLPRHHRQRQRLHRPRLRDHLRRHLRHGQSRQAGRGSAAPRRRQHLHRQHHPACGAARRLVHRRRRRHGLFPRRQRRRRLARTR